MGCAGSSEDDSRTGGKAPRKGAGSPDDGERPPVSPVDLTRQPSKSAIRATSRPGKGRRISWATENELKMTADDIVKTDEEADQAAGDDDEGDAKEVDHEGTAAERGGTPDATIPASPLVHNHSQNERNAVEASASSDAAEPAAAADAADAAPTSSGDGGESSATAVVVDDGSGGGGDAFEGVGPRSEYVGNDAADLHDASTESPAAERTENPLATA